MLTNFFNPSPDFHELWPLPGEDCLRSDIAKETLRTYTQMRITEDGYRHPAAPLLQREAKCPELIGVFEHLDFCLYDLTDYRPNASATLGLATSGMAIIRDENLLLDTFVYSLKLFENFICFSNFSKHNTLESIQANLCEAKFSILKTLVDIFEQSDSSNGIQAKGCRLRDALIGHAASNPNTQKLLRPYLDCNPAELVKAYEIQEREKREAWLEEIVSPWEDSKLWPPSAPIPSPFALALEAYLPSPSNPIWHTALQSCVDFWTANKGGVLRSLPYSFTFNDKVSQETEKIFLALSKNGITNLEICTNFFLVAESTYQIRSFYPNSTLNEEKFSNWLNSHLKCPLKHRPSIRERCKQFDLSADELAPVINFVDLLDRLQGSKLRITFRENPLLPDRLEPNTLYLQRLFFDPSDGPSQELKPEHLLKTIVFSSGDWPMSRTLNEIIKVSDALMEATSDRTQIRGFDFYPCIQACLPEFRAEMGLTEVEGQLPTTFEDGLSLWKNERANNLLIQVALKMLPIASRFIRFKPGDDQDDNDETSFEISPSPNKNLVPG